MPVAPPATAVLATPRLGYLLLFVAAGIACLAGTVRALAVPDPGARRGLASLLALAGGWSGVAALRLLVADTGSAGALYVVGQLLGFAAVLAWIYFASAYTNRGVHRTRPFRLIAVAAYLGVLAVFVTNPIHGAVFTAERAAEPFLHLAVIPGPIYWFVTGLSYAGAAAGFYLLFDTVADTDYRSYRLLLVVATGVVPFAADVLLLSRPAFPALAMVPALDFGSASIAVFGISVLLFVDDASLRERMTVQRARRAARESLVDDLADPAILVDDTGRVFGANDGAAELLDGLKASERPRLSAAAPGLARSLVAGETTVELGEGRTFLLDRTRITYGPDRTAAVVALSEITEYEQQRRALARQTEQLDDIAAAVAHNLRNTSNLLLGYIDMADASPAAGRTETDGGTGSREPPLAVARRTAERVAAIAEDLHLLARYGQPVESTESLDPADAAREAWSRLGVEGTALICESGPPVSADRPRLLRLFRSLLEFHLENGATTITIERPPNGEGFAVSGDGRPLDPEEAEALLAFDSESSIDVPGVGLPVARALAEAHGWSLTHDPSADTPRFRVRVLDDRR